MVNTRRGRWFWDVFLLVDSSFKEEDEDEDEEEDEEEELAETAKADRLEETSHLFSLENKEIKLVHFSYHML